MDNMVKRNQTIILYLFLTVLILGCLNAPQDTTTPTTTQPRTPSTQVPTKEEVIQFRQAVSSGETSACDGLDDENLKSLCLRDVAVSKRDPSICENIPNKTLNENCYYKIAILMKDKSICENIKTPNVKNACVDRV
jgi:hypothetical protein